MLPPFSRAEARLRREPEELDGSARGARAPRMRAWEPVVIFLVSLLAFALLAPRLTTYLDPMTGDEPFYLMTAISIARDFDLNECNNYRSRDEAALYPVFPLATASGGVPGFPMEWKGWRSAPFPLPPHSALLVPPARQCINTDPSVNLPADGTGSELYSKHGLGLSLLVLPAFTLGGRALVVLFLNLLGALLAANIYLLAREATLRVLPAFLTWVAFSFTAPLLPYSFLIFPEMPAALFVAYAFRRIRLRENNRWQVAAIGFCIAFLPWLHSRFIPVTAGLLLYFLYQEFRHATKHRFLNLVLVVGQLSVAAVLLMRLFYHRSKQMIPNAADHAGSGDLAATARGAAGLFVDQQWGLFIAAPVFILSLVGLFLMMSDRGSRHEVLWLGIVFIPYFGVVANYAHWWGEWCPAARYLVATLPLLALPFGIALARVKSRAYLGIYAVLLLLSLGMMSGYLYQPQWMYHQPYERGNRVFTSGIRRLGGDTVVSHWTDALSNRLVDSVPSFVRPYFDSAEQGPEAGDAASALAWRKSLPISAFILVIVSLALGLRENEPDADRNY